jgi:hypothetical protein
VAAGRPPRVRRIRLPRGGAASPDVSSLVHPPKGRRDASSRIGRPAADRGSRRGRAAGGRGDRRRRAAQGGWCGGTSCATRRHRARLTSAGDRHPRDHSRPAGRGGRGRTFESCRAHGSTKPFPRAQNAEKCTIRTSYYSSASAGEAEEPCPAGARGEGVLGLADRGPRGVGASKGWGSSRSANVARTTAPRPQADRNRTRVSIPLGEAGETSVDGGGR